MKPFFYSEDCPKNILVPYLPEIMGKLESVLKAKVKDWTGFQKKKTNNATEFISVNIMLGQNELEGSNEL